MKEARAALTDLADSLATFHFPWPAAALRSYLSSGSPSLDEAFGLPRPTDAKPKPKSGKPAKTKAVKSPPRRPKRS
jgi:hypothetical protein